MSLSIADLRGRALTLTERGALYTNTELDRLLAPSGIPRGRITEIFGAPSSGKTSIALAALAACTGDGLFGAYVDLSHALFAPAAAGAGICLSRLLVVRPPNADLARRAVDAIVRCGACALVIFDCASAGEVLRTHHCARLASQAEKTGTALVALSKGDVPALASFASLRLRAGGLTPVWQAGDAASGRLAGCTTTVEVVKSRMNAPGRSTSVQGLLLDVARAWPIDGERSDVARRAELGDGSTVKVDPYKVDPHKVDPYKGDRYERIANA